MKRPVEWSGYMWGQTGVLSTELLIGKLVQAVLSNVDILMSGVITILECNETSMHDYKA